MGVVIIPSGATASININNFGRRQTGSWSPSRDMDDTVFGLVLNGTSAQYPITVEVADTQVDLRITGAITEGSKGDMIVDLPVVDMDAYRNLATHVIDGDFVFDGNDQLAESQDSSQYSNEIFYIKGKATINTYYHDLNFSRCVVIAEEGIDIINRYTPSDIDYVSLSRENGTREDVVFQVQNNTGADITLTNITTAWDGSPSAFYEHIRVRIISGTNYGWVWSYPLRAADGQQVSLSPDSVIPAGAIAEIEIENFKRRQTDSGGHNQDIDMDNERFDMTFWDGATPYETMVLRYGEEFESNGETLRFTRLNPYPALITKDGDINGEDSDEVSDCDINGIIYSLNGKVTFENLRLDGVIVANEIEFSEDLDLRYRPIYVPYPPPDFIAGMALESWQENQ